MKKLESDERRYDEGANMDLIPSEKWIAGLSPERKKMSKMVCLLTPFTFVSFPRQMTCAALVKFLAVFLLFLVIFHR